MTLTKNDLIETVHSKIGLTKNRSTDIVESLLEIIKQTLEGEENVLISGFGKFCVKEKRPRKGRNPVTGLEMALWGRRVVTFKCSGKLRERINGT